MERSKIYDILSRELLPEWKGKVEGDDGCGFASQEKELIEELTAELTDKGKKLLTSYTLAVENRIDYVYYNLKIKILNLGIKIGMELQQAFKEYEE